MRGFCPLASGSTGNSIYVGTKQTKLLFDVGISFRAIKEKLKEIDVAIDEIEGIVISHEHIDHIKGLEVLTKQLGIPVFCNADTAKAICSVLTVRPQFKIFSTGELFTFKDVQIHPFSIQHDTVDPVAFTLQFDGIKIGLCTDLGFATKLVERHLAECDYLYLEANHDEKMVHASARPMIYKQRVLGRQGHLSNRACGELLSLIHHPNLKHVFLAHLSSECNDPIVAMHTVEEILAKENKRVKLSIAYPHKVSERILFEN